MTITKQWPSGSDNPTPQNFNIPEAGEKNWSSLSNFLSALAGGTQATTFQKIAIRQATTTPITIASNDCLVTSKLAAPGAVTVNLPAGVAKQIFYIYDETGDASTNNITINRSGTDTIEGATSLVVNTDKELVGLAFDSSSSDWKIFVRCRPNISVGSISGLGAGVAAWLADPTSAKLATAVTDETGSGLLVFNNGPTFVAPALGTPASGVLTNCTGLPISSLTGSTTGTGALVFATSPTLVTPALGTPSSGTLSNCGGLPLTTGVTGILPIANGGTNASAKTAGFDNLSPTTTKGDIVANDGTNNARLGVGTNGQVLQADSTAPEGIKWGDADSGAGEINAVDNPSAASATTGYTAGTSHTVTRDTSNSPLDPTIGTCLDISASATVAESSTSGVYYSITTLPEAIRNWKLKVEFFVDVPATDEWSLSVYDGSTRLSLSTDDQTTGATVLPAGFTGRFSAYFNSTSNAAYSVNFTCTSYSAPTNLYVTNLVVGPGIGQAGAALEGWKAYTPITQGFGTISSVNAYYRRTGDSIELRGYFTAGTTTATEAQIGLPSGFTIAGPSSTVYAGKWLRDASPTETPDYSLLATNGDTYLNIGASTVAASNATSPANGSTVCSSSNRGVWASLPIPISELEGKGIIPMLVEDNLSEWQSYTPTFTGFGTTSSVAFQYRRVGDTVEIQGEFTSGTATATEAQITLPNGLTASYTQSNANIVGQLGFDNNTNQIFYSLATNGDTYLNIGRIIPAATTAATTPINGNSIAASGYIVSLNAKVQIAEWSGSQNSAVGYSQATGNLLGLVKKPDSEIRLDTGNGHGSTNTTIRRFSNTTSSTGSDMTLTQSSSNGDSITINQDGVYSITYTDRVTTSSGQHGISINASNLSGVSGRINNLAASERGISTYTLTTANNCSVTLRLSANDIIRAQTDGFGNESTGSEVQFVITQLFKL